MVNTLENYILVDKQAIDIKFCDFILKEHNDWEIHTWSAYNKRQPIIENDPTELSVSDVKLKSKLIINQVLENSIEKYLTIQQNSFLVKKFSNPRLNKYEINQSMKRHVDHIHTLFSETGGIPILSIVGLLSKDFIGGDFIFWDDHKINLEMGDVLIFPSNFLYPHRVDPVISGTRYSFVSWAY